MVYNIIEVSEMEDVVSEFMTNGESVLYVGGCCGTTINNIVFNSVLGWYEPTNVLVVEGCQDMLYLSKTNSERHCYYADLFHSMIVDSIIPHDEFTPTMLKPKIEYQTLIIPHKLKNKEVIIFRDAHLIPEGYMKAIKDTACCKLIFISDPFDIQMNTMYNVPMITDTLMKLPATLGLARQVYGVETRVIDKRVACSFSKSRKMNIRSIGKMDNNQYVSDDIGLINEVRNKQLSSKIRKGNKFIVDSNIIYNPKDMTGKELSINRGSLIINNYATEINMCKFNIFTSKEVFVHDVSYIENHRAIQVIPGNIMTVEEASLHRFKNTIVVLTEPDISKANKYSILKNSLNVSLCNM